MFRKQRKLLSQSPKMTDPTQGFITFEERPEGVGAVPRLQERGDSERDEPGAGGAGARAWRELRVFSALVFRRSWSSMFPDSQ